MKLGNSDARVSVWTAVTVVLSILLAVGGVAYGWVQKSADTQHVILGEKIAIVERQQTDDEVMLTQAMKKVADLNATVEAVQLQTQYIPKILETLIALGKRTP
jgi:hypothetical protein